MAASEEASAARAMTAAAPSVLHIVQLPAALTSGSASWRLKRFNRHCCPPDAACQTGSALACAASGRIAPSRVGVLRVALLEERLDAFLRIRHRREVGADR